MHCLLELNGVARRVTLIHSERVPYLPNEAGAPHSHGHFQHIIYYPSGHGRILIKKDWHAVIPGQLWLIDARTRHCFHAALRDPQTYLEATFTIRPHLPLTRLVRELANVPGRWENPFLPSAEFREDIEGILQRLSQQSIQDRVLNQAFVSLRIWELILTLARAVQEQARSTAAGPARMAVAPARRGPLGRRALVEAIRIYLRKNFRRPLAIEELAAYLRCSPSTAAHLFKAQTRHTIGEELRRMRLNHAKELLRNSERTIARIAESCGFGDAAHFCRFFKRMEQLSPKAYREKCG